MTTPNQPMVTVPLEDVQRALAVCKVVHDLTTAQDWWANADSLIGVGPIAGVALEHLEPIEAQWLKKHPEETEEG